jgi:signal transduction histidine kinase
VSTHLSVEDGARAGTDQDALIYRVVRESLRNVQSHASADNVWVRVQPQDPVTTLVCIEDDGTGFSPGERERRAEEGHLGLSLLEGVVRQAGGRLDVRSVPGRGTTVVLEVPA